ncbi:DUF6422 family protein [Streptomyces specialis]|uniref:DUF6422 family protein n=1 Tax=Streptomyces specialis TaxID=498367 RepID=UPI00073E4AE8|nr:DUF6422 family protein [Streptomyces specialis]
MPAYHRRDDLTEEQSEVLEQAASHVIGARKEAAAMLEEAGVDPAADLEWFGNPCGECACSDFSGFGESCETLVFGPGGSPDHMEPCGHQPSQHLPT